MMKIAYIIGLKLTNQVRQPKVFLAMLVLPLMMTYFVGAMAVDESHQVPIMFVDEDKSRYSWRVTQSFENNPDYRVLFGDRNEAIQKVRGFEIHAAFVLCENFGRHIEQGLPPRVDIYLVHESGELIATQQVFRATVAKAAANSNIAELALAEISRDKVITGREDIIRERAYQNALEKWFPTAPVSLHLVNHKNTTTRMSNQMVHTSTGFALFFCMFTVILAMGNILDEKREGTWQRLLTMPVSRRQILAGNFGSTFLIGMTQILLLVITGAYIFGVNWGSNLPGTLLVLAAFMFCVTGLGLALSGLVKTTAQLAALTPILVVSTSMLGGCFWPLDVVTSDVLLTLARFVPQSWAIIALNDLVVRDAALSAALPSVGVLLLMGAVFCGMGLTLINRRIWTT
ncbi:ABC transporter permease [Desulfoscipio gibsoniae]